MSGGRCLMKFKAKIDTADKRLTAGKIYVGSLIHIPGIPRVTTPGIRIAVYDNTGTWMTFSPTAFKPAEERP